MVIENIKYCKKCLKAFDKGTNKKYCPLCRSKEKNKNKKGVLTKWN